GRRYGYIRAEIDLYSRLGVAVPRKHPTRRINELYAQMNMAVFEDKQCDLCNKQISVALNRTNKNRKIFCHNCYLKYLEEHG
ncbi:MAG: hypothetical protein ABIH21_05775, partial [Patescibacteria group bacterium]